MCGWRRAEMLPIADIAAARRPLKLSGVPAGLLPWLAADLARAAGLAGRRVLLVASDEAAGRTVVETAPFFAPELKTIWLPAWDCLPYDRASPAQKVLAERLAALAALAQPAQGAQGFNIVFPKKAPQAVATQAVKLFPGVAAKLIEAVVCFKNCKRAICRALYTRGFGGG